MTETKAANPAPDGYLRVCWGSSGPVYSKWVGEGAEPATKPRKRKAKAAA